MIRNQTIRKVVKQWAYSTGLLEMWRRLRNRGRLTVVMFHRVLPGGHPAWSYSDPAWLVSDRALGECLRFFRRHYTVVGLEELLAIREGRLKEPPYPLLITFDDGWSDTAEYAAPLLKEHGLPAAVFVVADAVGERELWQEALIRAWRQRRLEAYEFQRLWEASGEGDWQDAPALLSHIDAIWRLIGRLSRMDSAQRNNLIRDVITGEGAPRKSEMLSLGELRSLLLAGLDVGSHGLTHTPIPYAPEPADELRCSRLALAEMLADASHPGLRAFSFPRGIYDQRAVAAAAEAGYQLLFTSDQRLDPTPVGASAPAVLGRINIPSCVVSDASGRFTAASLAAWLFLQPHRS
jgi:peptidoglycan/xylan/chitin deacetylase (PgdA/CDA1 family)